MYKTILRRQEIRIYLVIELEIFEIPFHLEKRKKFSKFEILRRQEIRIYFVIEL